MWGLRVLVGSLGFSTMEGTSRTSLHHSPNDVSEGGGRSFSSMLCVVNHSALNNDTQLGGSIYVYLSSYGIDKRAFSILPIAK